MKGFSVKRARMFVSSGGFLRAGPGPLPAASPGEG
jgi:hypothetical protein